MSNLYGCICLLMFGATVTHTSNAPISITLGTEENPIPAGTPISVTVTRTNLTDHVVNDSRTMEPMEYLTFDIKCDGQAPQELSSLRRARHEKEDGSPEPSFDFNPYIATLKPHESSVDVVELDKYYKIPHSSTCVVSVTQTTAPDPARGIPKIAVTSNSLVLHIL